MRRVQFVLLLLASLLPAESAFAYLDQINVKAEEIWLAAQEVLRVHGIKKADPSKFTIETRWVQDRVVRSRGFLKGLAKRTYQRRYRILLSITQRDYDSEVSVRGIFQERPIYAAQDKVMWQTIKPESADYDLERQVFMQILNRLELARNGG